MKSVLAIQCAPKGAKNKAEAYKMVDKAIEAIDASGLSYMVCPFETVVEGTLEQLLEVIKQAHEAVLEAGGSSVSSYIKLVTSPDLGSPDEKIAKYRAKGH